MLLKNLQFIINFEKQKKTHKENVTWARKQEVFYISTNSMENTMWPK